MPSQLKEALNPTLKIVGVLRAGDESLAEVALRRPSMPPWSKGWQAAQDFVLSRDNCTSLNNRSPSATRFGSRSTESGSGVMGSCGAELETSTPVLQTFAGCCAAADAQSVRSMAQRVRTAIFLFIFFSDLSTRHSSHLISLVARARTSGGIVRPICFAVFRLITNSNFVGCSTGRSAGLAPFRILST